jgi:hypothetical protein
MEFVLIHQIQHVLGEQKAARTGAVYPASFDGRPLPCPACQHHGFSRYLEPSAVGVHQRRFLLARENFDYLALEPDLDLASTQFIGKALGYFPAKDQPSPGPEHKSGDSSWFLPVKRRHTSDPLVPVNQDDGLDPAPGQADRDAYTRGSGADHQNFGFLDRVHIR